MFEFSKYAVLSLIAFLCVFSPVCKADSLENITFSGTATCITDACAYTVGPFTGSYTLDVTTQTVVGPWSISLPYTTISSTDAGSYADITGASVTFGESNSTTLDYASLFFSPGDLAEIGTLTNASNFCAPFAGLGYPACYPDAYNLTGATSLASTAAPEPSQASLLLGGLLLLLGISAATSIANREKAVPELT
jgi:hypothetical protein